MNELNDTTNLNDLPSNNENIKIDISNPQSNIVESNTINELVSGIQDAGGGNVLELPSRDISKSTATITTDEKINVNYIPKSQDYIQEYETKEEILKKENLEKNKKDNIDFLFNEFNIYILMGLLYFMFQLPFFNKYMFKYLPLCFNGDGNLNFQGLLVKSALFSVAIYAIEKLINKLIDL
tara:strand:+ start:178 stop:720 length:543 start_codon:yes stop_codon:yes gene_type:complete